MATLEQLETMLGNATKAGDLNAARKIKALIQRGESERAQDPILQFAEQTEGPQQVEGTVARPPEQGVNISQIPLGVAETGATLATGTAAQVPAMGTFLKSLAQEVIAGKYGTQEAADRIQKNVEATAREFTYNPRTQAGREIVGAVGKVGEALTPLTPLAAGVSAVSRPAAAQIAQTARSAAPGVKQAITQQGSKIAQQGANIVDKTKQILGKESQPDIVEGKGSRSVGARSIDEAELLQEASAELPVPISLTKGDLTRDRNQLQFEEETAKLPQGDRLRQVALDKNQQVLHNIDAFIDQTGAELGDNIDVGFAVTEALNNRVKKDKAKIKVLYKEAEKKGELSAPVTLDAFAEYLNNKQPEAINAPILQVLESKALQTGAIVRGPDGNLVAKPTTLKTAEEIRKSINESMDTQPTNIRQGSIVKSIIDETTEKSGGDVYKKARQARAKFARDYSDTGLIERLLNTKRNTEDRKIAVENVVNESIISESASKASIEKLRMLLKSSGDEGRQAWKELQGATVRYIQDQAYKSATLDERRNPILSVDAMNKAIKKLDRGGKLDLIFTKQGADKMRLLRDVVQEVITRPPGTINTSNTATALAGLLDLVIVGTTGMPAPVASAIHLLKKSIDNKKLQKRIDDALLTPTNKD